MEDRHGGWTWTYIMDTDMDMDMDMIGITLAMVHGVGDGLDCRMRARVHQEDLSSRGISVRL